VEVRLTVNDQAIVADVEPRELLALLLRDRLGLTGTHVGCDTSSCGACTVLIDGRSAKSCTILAVQVEGHRITTIEGLAAESGGEELHPVQQAFHEQHALQCGYCTSGMVMAAVSLIEENDQLDREAVRAGLKGNLCRCTGYQNIVSAVVQAADRMKRADA
jgi:aerobic carbon-monoxide dehydrogenase small subunit